MMSFFGRKTGNEIKKTGRTVKSVFRKIGKFGKKINNGISNYFSEDNKIISRIK